MVARGVPAPGGSAGPRGVAPGVEAALIRDQTATTVASPPLQEKKLGVPGVTPYSPIAAIAPTTSPLSAAVTRARPLVWSSCGRRPSTSSPTPAATSATDSTSPPSSTSQVR